MEQLRWSPLQVVWSLIQISTTGITCSEAQRDSHPLLRVRPLRQYPQSAHKHPLQSNRTHPNLLRVCVPLPPRVGVHLSLFISLSPSLSAASVGCLDLIGSYRLLRSRFPASPSSLCFSLSVHLSLSPSTSLSVSVSARKLSGPSLLIAIPSWLLAAELCNSWTRPVWDCQRAWFPLKCLQRKHTLPYCDCI